MNSKKSLTSAVMLETQWQTRQRDLIDLITPFIDFCVAKNTSIKEKIDIRKVRSDMEILFGYKDIPDVIFTRVFARNKTNYRKESKDYILINPLDEVVERFNHRKKECEKIIDSIGDSLYNYLSLHCKNEKIYDKENALNLLHSFFGFYGLDIGVRDVRIDGISKKSNEAFYYIARYIIENKADDTHNYKNIIELINGYYLETAIYLQPDNGNLISANYKNVKIYYDTPFLIHLLGYQSKEEQESAKRLHEMLQNQKASFYYFPQTNNEIIGILNAYKHSLFCIAKGQIEKNHRTLEGLDERNYRIDDVERLISVFQNTLKTSFKIELVNNPLYQQKSDGSVEESRVLDESDIADYIKSQITHYKEDNLAADITSAMSIHKLRTGDEGLNIENCKHIFVTTNKDFVRAFNKYYKEHIQNDTCELTIDTNKLAAITWVKSKNVNDNISELQLLEMAYSAQQPLPELVEKMSEILYKMEQEGTIGFNEAVSLRSDHFIKKELMLKSSNNPEMINEVLVNEIRDSYKEHLIKSTRNTLQSDYEKAQRLEASKNIENIQKKAHEEAKKAKEKRLRRINIVLVSFRILIILGAVMGLCISWNQNTKGFCFFAYLMLTIVTTISIVDTVFTKRLFLSKIIEKRINNYETRVFDKKYSEYMDLYEKKHTK